MRRESEPFVTLLSEIEMQPPTHPPVATALIYTGSPVPQENVAELQDFFARGEIPPTSHDLVNTTSLSLIHAHARPSPFWRPWLLHVWLWLVL